MFETSPLICSRELQLLISCCNLYKARKDQKESALSLVREIDQQEFLELVDRHTVAPLVFDRLRDHPGLSSLIKEQLKSRAEQIHLRALLSMAMVIRLQKKMDELAVKGIFLKGVSLSAIYYGDVGLRDSLDIDIWVEQKGFNAISNFLTSLGYRSSYDSLSLNQKQIAFKSKTEHHVLFSTKDPGLPAIIELHWKLRGRFGSFTFEPEKNHEKTIRYVFSGTALSVMDHIDHFLFLCTHGSEHAWFRLKWLFDFPRVIQLIESDWNAVQRRAKELNCLKEVHLTFLVMNRILNYEIPFPFISSPINFNLKSQLNYIEHCILYRGRHCDTVLEKLLYLRYSLAMNRKGGWNPHLLLRYLTNENDWKALPMPEKLFFLYFPFRPFLFIWRKFLH